VQERTADTVKDVAAAAAVTFHADWQQRVMQVTVSYRAASPRLRIETKREALVARESY
jgi:hypothetical protein